MTYNDCTVFHLVDCIIDYETIILSLASSLSLLYNYTLIIIIVHKIDCAWDDFWSILDVNWVIVISFLSSLIFILKLLSQRVLPNSLSLANLEGHFMTIKAQLWSERLKQILIQEIWWWEYFETMDGNLRNWDDIR